jgi:hypothetical protein
MKRTPCGDEDPDCWVGVNRHGTMRIVPQVPAPLSVVVWSAVNAKMRGLRQFALVFEEGEWLRCWRRDVVQEEAGLDTSGLESGLRYGP